MSETQYGESDLKRTLLLVTVNQPSGNFAMSYNITRPMVGETERANLVVFDLFMRNGVLRKLSCASRSWFSCVCFTVYHSII